MFHSLLVIIIVGKAGIAGTVAVVSPGKYVEAARSARSAILRPVGLVPTLGFIVHCFEPLSWAQAGMDAARETWSTWSTKIKDF